jgi:hypothetical protein
MEYTQYNPQSINPNDDNAILAVGNLPLMEITDNKDNIYCEALFIGEIYEYVEQHNLTDILTKSADTLEQAGHNTALAIVDVDNRHFSECGEYARINQAPYWVRLDNGYA